MDRRSFIALFSGAALWPLRAGAQQNAVPVIGYLGGGAPDLAGPFLAAFRQGLTETGYVDGKNLVIEYRWADGHYDRLPRLAADLVQRKVAVLAAMGGTPTIMAAKGAASTIPIVFLGGGDLVADGVVASLARPGGNVTGISIMAVELNEKRLDLLAELVPRAGGVALLINPSNSFAKRTIGDLKAAAQAKGLRLDILSAVSESDIDGAFSSLDQRHEDGILVAADPFFNSRREHLVALASRHAVPAIYEWREFAVAGGLISYGASPTYSDKSGAMLAGFLPELSRLICRSSNPPNLSW